MTQNNIVMNEIVKMIKSVSCSKGWKQSILHVIICIPQIFLIIILKHYTTNSWSLIESIKFVMDFFIKLIRYKKVKLEMYKEELNINHYIYKILKNDYNLICDDREEFTFVQIPRNKNFMSKVLEKANDKLNKKMKETKKCIGYELRIDGGKFCYKKISPMHLFSSSNYVNLKGIIDCFIETSILTKTSKVIGILIDSEPGQGKSTFMRYLSNYTICDKCYRIDMTEFITVPFDGVIKSAFTKIIEPSVYMIDEVDKYIHYQIKNSYDEYIQKKIKDEEENIETYEYFCEKEKVKFLFGIVKLLEQTQNDAPSVIIFCSNNFDTIFEGIDMTHFESLITRFKKVRFNHCDKNNAMEFIRFNNDSFIGTKYYTDKDQLENIISKINDDLKVSYRELDQIYIDCQKNPEQTVHELNHYKPNKYKSFAKLESENKNIFSNTNNFLIKIDSKKKSKEKESKEEESKEKESNEDKSKKDETKKDRSKKDESKKDKSKKGVSPKKELKYESDEDDEDETIHEVEDIEIDIGNPEQYERLYEIADLIDDNPDEFFKKNPTKKEAIEIIKDFLEVSAGKGTKREKKCERINKMYQYLYEIDVKNLLGLNFFGTLIGKYEEFSLEPEMVGLNFERFRSYFS